MYKSKASASYIRIGIQFVFIKETITVSLAFEILLIMELKLRKNLDLDDLKSNVNFLPETKTIPRYFRLLDQGTETSLIIAEEQCTSNLLPKRIQTDFFRLIARSRSVKREFC